jgi:hypothetical protein
MAIPGITYRLEKGSSLTHLEMDDNFRSVFYSSSLHDDGATLRLHYDTNAGDYYTIPLGGSSTGSVAVINNTNNNILTATGFSGSLQGEPSFTFDGTTLILTGSFSIDDSSENILIGEQAGASISGANKNILIGYQAGENLTGVHNTVVGYQGLDNVTDASGSTAVGYGALGIVSSGNNNIGIGKEAGVRLSSGTDNIYIGYQAGPETNTAQSNKLYIHNTGSNTPLVYGDFATGQITFNSQVSASIFSGSFYGDGSNLTGLTVTTEWDGSRDGDSSITGSFVVSGSGANVDFTNAEAGVSGSFSGSFVGDGSGLTGVTSTSEWDGSRNGNASITGSFVVSGSSPTIDLKGDTTIDTNIKICNPSTTGMAIGACVYANTTATDSNGLGVGIGYQAGQLSKGGYHVVIGAQAGQCVNTFSTFIGYQAGRCNTGTQNVLIGPYTATSGTGASNVAIGLCAISNATIAAGNVAVGLSSMRNLTNGCRNTAIGNSALGNLTSNSYNNTAIGCGAGLRNTGGCDNIYIGYATGPSSSTAESCKLYINNTSGAPLIGGDFSAKTVTISGSLLVSQSVTATTYYGDGSNLTGFEWDGTHLGNANITGSFTVSGSTAVVDFTDVAAISGSTFSGSFVGDGSGLTGITTDWDGTLNGDAQITGSLIVSGNLDVAGTFTIASGSYPAGPGVQLFQFNASGLTGTSNIYTFAIDGSTGYTGIKGDYVLTNNVESEKKVGTILGGWDQAGNSTINDSHTVASGNIVGTSFSIDASSTTEAILKIDASPGTYELNMLITAFKRSL